MDRPIRIALVAGEPSGDILGAGLIEQLKKILPSAQFYGIAGPKMIAQGCEAIFPMERLSVMGLVIKQLLPLWSMRKKFIQQLINTPPAVFIGIDAPDFNLGLEIKLKAAGIVTVHYVSPSVWAWRPKRIYKIKKAVHLMLTLFPFEKAIYQEHQIPVKFVGHSLADKLMTDFNTDQIKQELSLPVSRRIIALLPGSRMGELNLLLVPFLQAAQYLKTKMKDVHFVMPLVNSRSLAYYEQIKSQLSLDLPLTVLQGHSHAAMAAAEVILVASGTATLEALLLEKPMVVAYKLKPTVYWLVKRMVKIPSVSLPNLLAQKPIIEEILQDQVTPERLGEALLALLSNTSRQQEMIAQFQLIKRGLQQNADVQAANAVVALLNSKNTVSGT